jgi:hypothetical protein
VGILRFSSTCHQLQILTIVTIYAFISSVDRSFQQNVREMIRLKKLSMKKQITKH